MKLHERYMNKYKANFTCEMNKCKIFLFIIFLKPITILFIFQMLDLISPMEIVSLVGTLSGGGHLHVSLSDCSGKTVGGHLLELVVDTTAEIIIGDCSTLAFERTYDESTGFHELQISDR